MEQKLKQFKRARSDQQKELRMQQIMDATLALYHDTPYQKISLSSIAKELNFTRANLYKYVKTKEEIFLHILIRETEKAVAALHQVFITKDSLSIEEFALLWAQTFDKHPLFIQLMAIMYSIIEKNVSLENLVQFKTEFTKSMVSAGAIIQHALPQLSEETINQFMSMQMFYAMGLYPASNETEVQTEAIARSGIPYYTPDFVEEFSRFIRLTIKGLSSK